MLFILLFLLFLLIIVVFVKNNFFFLKWNQNKEFHWNNDKEYWFLISLEEIDKIQFINGISIEKIELRAKPISDNLKDPKEWKFRSFDGFLGEKETFKERLKKDWKIIENIGVTHKELANHLKKILYLTEQKRKEEKLGEMTEISIEYYGQPFLISRQLFHDYQYSLFYNYDNSKYENSELNTKWKEEYHILHKNLNLSIIVAGFFSKKIKININFLRE